MTLDWNLGYTTQNEIGGANFYNQSVSQPANTYTPLFNINQGVPAFVSVATVAERRNSHVGLVTLGPAHHHRVSG